MIRPRRLIAHQSTHNDCTAFWASGGWRCWERHLQITGTDASREDGPAVSDGANSAHPAMLTSHIRKKRGTLGVGGVAKSSLGPTKDISQKLITPLTSSSYVGYRGPQDARDSQTVHSAEVAHTTSERSVVLANSRWKQFQRSRQHSSERFLQQGMLGGEKARVLFRVYGLQVQY